MNHCVLHAEASINDPPMINFPNNTVDSGYVKSLYFPYLLVPDRREAGIPAIRLAELDKCKKCR